jgi:hypothetical protein
MGQMVTITDNNYLSHFHPTVDGEFKRHGLMPRNFKTKPTGYCAFAPKFDIPLIPESEWQGRLDAQKAARARLSDIRETGMFGSRIPSRDQDGKGYCWAHSSTGAALLLRARDNQPYADLSAFAVACMIKGFRDEGGCGIDSTEFIATKGIPTAEFWPQQSMRRDCDNPQTWENAAQNKFIEWMDFGNPGSDQMWAMQVTCALLAIPVVIDLNWWGHSVCQMDVTSLKPRKILILNSWGDSWSENGAGELEESRAIADSAVAPRVILASLV